MELVEGDSKWDNHCRYRRRSTEQRSFHPAIRGRRRKVPQRRILDFKALQEAIIQISLDGARYRSAFHVPHPGHFLRRSGFLGVGWGVLLCPGLDRFCLRTLGLIQVLGATLLKSQVETGQGHSGRC